MFLSKLIKDRQINKAKTTHFQTCPSSALQGHQTRVCVLDRYISKPLAAKLSQDIVVTAVGSTREFKVQKCTFFEENGLNLMVK